MPDDAYEPPPHEYINKYINKYMMMHTQLIPLERTLVR